jgi:hypothetical protein
MTLRVVRAYPPDVLTRMVGQLETASVEIQCLEPDLHPTCWVRSSAVQRGYLVGYSQVTVKGHVTLPGHWAAYLALIGPVDDPALELDHRCFTPPCWNPWHMEPVTRAVNNGRKLSVPQLRRHRDASGRLL